MPLVIGTKQRSHIPPAVCAGEQTALIQEALPAHSIVESYGGITALGEQNARLDAALEEAARSLLHQTPTQTQSVVLPAEIDPADDSFEFAETGASGGKADQAPASVLEHDDELPGIRPAEHLLPLGTATWPGVFSSDAPTLTAIGILASAAPELRAAAVQPTDVIRKE